MSAGPELVATIEQVGSHYYVLTMGENEMGGTSKSRLAKYARERGYRVVNITGQIKRELRAEVWE